MSLATPAPAKSKAPAAKTGGAGALAAPMLALSLAGLLALGLLGADPAAWLNGRALAIVLGGTALVMVLSAPIDELRALVRALYGLWADRPADLIETHRQWVALASALQKKGPRAFEATRTLRTDPFGRRLVAFLEDGLEADEIARLLSDELASYRLGLAAPAALMRRAADTAPAIGLIGTLVGLVEMLRTLQDPAGIGPGMAVALLTTFYGALLAHLVFAPLAARLERRAALAATAGLMAARAAEGITRGLGPRRIDRLLTACLAPGAGSGATR